MPEREKCIITLLDQKESFDDGIAKLKKMGIDAVWEKSIIRSSRDPKVVIAQCRGYDYVFAGGEVWNKEVFEACPEVKLIVRLGVGYDGIDLEDASNAGVPVCYMPGFNSRAVAEQTVALMLCALRKISYMDKKMHQGDKKGANFATNQLSGKSVGLLGCGNIGKRVAKILLAFDCKVIAYDPQPDEAFAKKYDIEYADIDTVLSESDVISLHLPLTPETKWIINSTSISKMKKNVVIINTSRGGTINSQDLAEALHCGKISGAALDVFEDEGGQKTSVGTCFAQLDNVVMTPHVSGSTVETLTAMMDHAIDVLSAFKEDGELPYLLNPKYKK